MMIDGCFSAREYGEQCARRRLFPTAVVGNTADIADISKAVRFDVGSAITNKP